MLRGLPDDVAGIVVRASRRRLYASNDAIIHAGDPGGCVHLVRMGHVAIMVSTPLGQQLMFSVLGPGESFGELSVLLGGLRTASARALEPTETLALQAADLDRLRRDHQEVSDALLRVVCAQVTRLSARLSEHLYLPVEARIRRRLLELCEVYGPGRDSVTIPLPQDRLAELAGAARPTVNRVLKKDEEARIVRLGRGAMTVLDRRALGRRAQLDQD